MTMANAYNANTRVAYIEEVTENTTPATPAFDVARITGESLNVERNVGFSSELDGNRGQKSHALMTKSGSGSIDAEWSFGSFDALLESALRSAWATDVLVDGDTPKSFTFEVGFEAGATDIYKRLTGVQVATLDFEMAAGGVVKTKFGLMGRTGDFANAAIAGSTYVDAGDEPVIVGAGVGGFVLSGITVGCVPSLSLQIANNLTPQYCLGSFGPSELVPGELEVTGQLQMFLSSAQYTLLRAYADTTEHSLQFDIGDVEDETLQVLIPSIIFENLTVATQAANGSVLIDTGFRAKQSNTLTNKVIQLSRV